MIFCNGCHDISNHIKDSVHSVLRCQVLLNRENQGFGCHESKRLSLIIKNTDLRLPCLPGFIWDVICRGGGGDGDWGFPFIDIAIIDFDDNINPLTPLVFPDRHKMYQWKPTAVAVQRNTITNWTSPRKTVATNPTNPPDPSAITIRRNDRNSCFFHA